MFLYLEGTGWAFPNNTPLEATEAAADWMMFSAPKSLDKCPLSEDRRKSESLKYDATSHASSIASSLKKSKTATKLKISSWIRQTTNSINVRQQHTLHFYVQIWWL